MPKLLRLVNEVVGVGLWHNPPLIWLLHKVLIPLFLCKLYCLLLRSEIEMGTLHRISGRLPPHQRIFPSMTFLQYIPIQSPMMRVPCTRLCSCLRWPKYSDYSSVHRHGQPCKILSTYLTWRACKSTGAPESTAAATISPGSLPSITLFGTGEKVLRLVSQLCQPHKFPDLRGAVVHASVIIWFMRDRRF